MRKIDWNSLIGLKRGSKGLEVKRLQTILDDIGYGLVIDGDFGPATEMAYTRATHKCHPLPIKDTGIDSLKQSWTDAMTWYAGQNKKVYSIPSRIVQIAQDELNAGAREIGGNNMGPWVRKYMNGHEGKDWAWCVGFATWCVAQAFAPDKSPFKERYSTSKLTIEAQNLGKYVADKTNIYPGCLFVIKGVHTGIIKAVYKYNFETIEGNSHLPDEHNGDRVCSKFRGYSDKIGFILV